MNYYYLGAALPGLSMDARPPLSAEEFRSMASEHLCSRDMAAVLALASLWDGECAHPFVALWKKKETTLRNAMAKARASALKKDPEKFLRHSEYYDADADRAAAEALSKPSPLEKEQVLDRHRWYTLGEMAGFNQFSSEAILAYSVRLSIAQRWSSMDEDIGRKVADTVITSEADKTGEQTISENNETASKI